MERGFVTRINPSTRPAAGYKPALHYFLFPQESLSAVVRLVIGKINTVDNEAALEKIIFPCHGFNLDEYVSN
ncbi:MAG TPA: hypothetical protein DHW77_08065 [Verrucomicrobiales bacterium]|nr:hypothetical protein [Verrucomicrobiales bacterium]